MYHICRALGCGEQTSSRYSTLCARHKATFRRHGAADQRSITKAALKPHLKAVRRRIEKNPNSPAWTTLDARWVALVDHAQAIVSQSERGQAGPRHERAAAYEILKLAGDQPARAIVETTLAVVMMWELEPRTFRSDRAFWVQLSRRVRALTDVNFGERYDHSTGRVKRAYRELAPRAAVALGQWLAETLGVGGIHLAKLEREEQQKRVEEGAELRRALSELS